jgi:NADH-quinone oxidoreductase subunit N
MMAYSSISHAGFILVGVQVATADGISASLLYVLVYAVLVIGTFAVITVVGESSGGDQSFDAYRGLSRRRPLLALVFTVLLLAQAGVPFTAGFIAKFGVITAAADAEEWVLALVAMVAAVIAIFLYLRVTVVMYTVEPDEGAPRIAIPVSAGIAIAVTGLFTVVFGDLPNPIVEFAKDAIPLAGF